MVAMMLVVSFVAVSILLFAQRNMADNVRLDFQREFRNELAALHSVQAVRHAVLAEHCRELARKPRIHAALEDGALDLLYPSARDELLDVMAPEQGASRDPGAHALRALYYRFLDARGRAIASLPPPPSRQADPDVAVPARRPARSARWAPALRLRAGCGHPRYGGELAQAFAARGSIKSVNAERQTGDPPPDLLKEPYIAKYLVAADEGELVPQSR